MAWILTFRYSSGFCMICSPSVLTGSRLFRYSSGFHVICSPSVALIYGEQLLEICRLYLNGSLRQKSLGYIGGKSALHTYTIQGQISLMYILERNRLHVRYDPLIVLPDDLIYSTVTLVASFLFDSSDRLSIS